MFRLEVNRWPGVYPPIGSYGVTRTSTVFGNLIRHWTESPEDHAFVYMGNGEIMEATPKHGFVRGHLFQYPDAIFNLDDKLTPEAGAAIVEAAWSLEGRPYGFLDIAYLSLAYNGVHWHWLLEQVARQDRLICSQAVDLSYVMARTGQRGKGPSRAPVSSVPLLFGVDVPTPVVTPGMLRERLR